MTAGRSLADREAQRQAYIDRAVASGRLAGMTIRCRDLQDDLDHPDHRYCRGEDRGNSGCLCRCHDNPGAEIIASSTGGQP